MVDAKRSTGETCASANWGVGVWFVPSGPPQLGPGAPQTAVPALGMTSAWNWANGTVSALAAPALSRTSASRAAHPHWTVVAMNWRAWMPREASCAKSVRPEAVCRMARKTADRVVSRCQAVKAAPKGFDVAVFEFRVNPNVCAATYGLRYRSSTYQDERRIHCHWRERRNALSSSSTKEPSRRRHRSSPATPNPRRNALSASGTCSRVMVNLD